MSYSVVLNKNHITNLGSGNNRFLYAFPASQTFTNQSIAISQLSMYYCWQNIKASLNNNKIEYKFPSGYDTITCSITIPDGNYEISDLNSMLHLYMKKKGHYLIDSSGNDVYFISLTLLTSQYKVGLECKLIGSTLPSGWSFPSNVGFDLPHTSSYAQLVILSNDFQNIIGYSANTYPSKNTGSSDYVAISSSIPQISPVQCLLFQCNLCYNPYSPIPSVIYATTNNDAIYGSLIPSSIYTPQFNKISDGAYNFIEIRITDQDLKDVELLDCDVVIMLQIKSN